MKIQIEKKKDIINIIHQNGCVIARAFHLGDAERIVKIVNEYEELKEENNKLKNDLFIANINIKTLESQNRELVKNLKCINENTTDKMVKAHTGALLRRYEEVE